MKINLQGDINLISEGLELLSEDYGFELSDDGIFLKAIHDGDISISISDEKAEIHYNDKSDFFRMFSFFLQKKEGFFEKKEKKYFDTCGAMIDLSHGALLKTGTIKSILRKMSLMGLNMLMMYFEESYTVPEYPYFGYMRGRYTKEELRDIDRYASILGIEVIPAIQTIGHLSNTLRWESFGNIKDTDDCLLVGKKETYSFIEACIKNISECFTSDRIHIGFDETMSLGSGEYRRIHGYRNRIDIFLEHLEKVSVTCKSIGKTPLIWSDMFFRLRGSASGYALDNKEIPADVAQRIPENVELVEANYSMTDTKKLEERLKAHTDTGRKTWFAGAVHDWHGFCVNYSHTFAASDAALMTAKKLGLKEVFLTTWGDDSPERDYMCTLLGYQLYAEHMYNRTATAKDAAERFSFCCKCPAELILKISEIDMPIREYKQNDKSGEIILDSGRNMSNPSKYLMWQDVPAGLFDTELEKLDYPAHFAACMKKIGEISVSGEYEITQKFYMSLCNTLNVKCRLAKKIMSAYKHKDKAALDEIRKTLIPQLSDLVRKTWEENRALWFARHKPFGWEVLERRYGTLLLRLESLIYRLNEFINGNIQAIEELEEKRLPVVSGEEPAYFNNWRLTSTAWGR